MAKEIQKVVKIQIEAGKATPAPPVGTICGPLGINLQEFCSRYNEETRDKMGDIIPVELYVYDDKSFDFVLKTPPTSSLILKAAKVAKASAKGANQIIAVITQDDVRKIAEIKMPDLNSYDIETAMKSIIGTARNMGIAVKGINDAELNEQAAEAAKAEEEMAKLEAELEAMEESAKEAAESDEAPEVGTTQQAAEAAESENKEDE